jgi:DNA-binding MarR family transcriptional regulator
MTSEAQISPAMAFAAGDLSDNDVRHLAKTVDHLVNIAVELGLRVRDLDRARPARRRSLAAADAAVVPPSCAALVDLARRMISHHREQPLFGSPELFDNRHWLLVLELFIADSCEAEVSVKEATLALGGAQSTALRKLLALERLGVVVSRDDPHDGRRRLIGLSHEATGAVRDYLTTHSSVPHGAGRLRLRLRSTRVLPDDPPVEAELEPAPAASVCGSSSVLQR